MTYTYTCIYFNTAFGTTVTTFPLCPGSTYHIVYTCLAHCVNVCQQSVTLYNYAISSSPPPFLLSLLLFFLPSPSQSPPPLSLLCPAQIDNDGLKGLNIQCTWQSKGHTYWVCFSSVEILGYPKSSSPSIKPGDRVRVKRSVQSPK